jgi:hypothetical protein
VPFSKAVTFPWTPYFHDAYALEGVLGLFKRAHAAGLKGITVFPADSPMGRVLVAACDGIACQVGRGRGRSSGVNHAQAQHCLERVEVAIVVQQLVALAQTQGGDEAINSLPDRVAPRPQAAIVSR